MSDRGVVLVTGADGFVGRSVCALLRRMGIDYVALDQRPSQEPGIPWETCDISEPASVSAVFRKNEIRTVIHVAAVLRTASISRPELATRVNIVGSTNLIDAAVTFRAEAFVFGSSISVYGSEGNGPPLSEDCPARPTDLYGAAKHYVEIYGETVAKGKDLNFSALRIANVVGPGARGTASPWRSEIFERFHTGRSQTITIPYPDHAVLSLVHVEDVASMLVSLALAENRISGVYNTPAHNWRALDLKREVEAQDPTVRVELDNRSQRRSPPVVDGTKFTDAFRYQALPLAERLRRAAMSGA